MIANWKFYLWVILLLWWTSFDLYLGSLVQELLLDSVSPATLDDIFTLLEPWLVKKNCHQRAASIKTLHSVLQCYVDNVNFGYEVTTCSFIVFIDIRINFSCHHLISLFVIMIVMMMMIQQCNNTSNNNNKYDEDDGNEYWK